LAHAAGWSIVLHLVLAIELVLYPVPVAGDDTWYGWSQLAVEVERRAERYPEAFLFSGDSYKTTAQLAFRLDRPVHGPEVLGDPRFHFRYVWGGGEDLVGRDALLFDSVRPTKDGVAPVPEDVVRHFHGCEPLAPISIFHRGDEVRRFRVYHCDGYLGPAVGSR
jgi:hypothetical protein